MFSTSSPRKKPLWCPGSVEVTSWQENSKCSPSGAHAGITKAALEQLRADVVTDLTSPRPQSRPIGAHDELKLMGRKVHQLSSFVMDIVKMLEAKIDMNDKKHMGSLQEIQDELRSHGQQLSSLGGKPGVRLPKLDCAAPPEQEKKKEDPVPLKPVPPSEPKASTKNPRQGRDWNKVVGKKTSKPKTSAKAKDVLQILDDVPDQESLESSLGWEIMEDSEVELATWIENLSEDLKKAVCGVLPSGSDPVASISERLVVLEEEAAESPKAAPCSPLKKETSRNLKRNSQGVQIDNSAAEKLAEERAAEPPPAPVPKLLQLDADGADEEEELEVFLDPRQSVRDRPSRIHSADDKEDSLEAFRRMMETEGPETVPEDGPTSQVTGEEEAVDVGEDEEMLGFVDPRQSMKFNGEDLDALVETMTGGDCEELDTFLEPTAVLDFMPPEEVQVHKAEVKRQSVARHSQLHFHH